MALNDYETSRSRGMPVELYLFSYGPGASNYFAYTDSETPVIYDGITYVPVTITRDEINASGTIDTDQLSIKLARNVGLVDLFRGFAPVWQISVRIRQGHVPSSDTPSSFAAGENFPVAYLGRIMEHAIEGSEATLTCEAASAAMKRSGLRRRYQWACPLVLYGKRCKVVKADATTTGTVTAINGNKITLSGGWMRSGAVAINYVGGMVEWVVGDGADYRTILAVNGNVLTLSGIIRNMLVGAVAKVSLGCGHTDTACQDLHNNIVNYGGHRHIPSFNPIGKNNHT